MKRAITCGAMILIFLATSVSASLLSAQGRNGCRSRGRAEGQRMYNPSTEAVVRGTVQEVQVLNGRRGWGGTHVVLKTDQENLTVHLGPSGFLANNNFAIAKGEVI